MASLLFTCAHLMNTRSKFQYPLLWSRISILVPAFSGRYLATLPRYLVISINKSGKSSSGTKEFVISTFLGIEWYSDPILSCVIPPPLLFTQIFYLMTNYLLSGRTGCSCPNCGRWYMRRESMTRHRNFECGQEPKFKCLLCLKLFKRKDKLKEHETKHHLKDPLLLADQQTTVNWTPAHRSRRVSSHSVGQWQN